MLLDIIRQAVREYNLLMPGDSVLVGLSGGADSVCLTHALVALSPELDITIYAAHLNHGIRGAEAERDEAFVKSFVKSLGIKFFVKRADIPGIAKKNGVSEETAGRQERYVFFDEICDGHNIKYIATAHNKNDNAETLLMNFIRGSGLKGLCGIPQRRGRIIRPLLGVGRKDIERYCADNGLDYITDSTNLSDAYTRNKIRRALLPLIEKELNPGVVDTITANARILHDDNAFLESEAKRFYSENTDGNSISVKTLLDADISIARRAVRLMLLNAYGCLNDIASGHVSDILSLAKKESGASVNLSDGVTARVEYGVLIIEKSADVKPFCLRIAVGESAVIEQTGVRVSTNKLSERARNSVCLSTPKGEIIEITVRNARAGDKFHPMGMRGAKTLSRYFIDSKIPRVERARMPIIEIDGEIAAVGGRIDERFKFTGEGIGIKFESV